MITFHRLGETSTAVTAQIAWQPDGVVEKAGAVLGFDDRRVQSDLDRFKDFIECRGSATGAWHGDVQAGS